MIIAITGSAGFIGRELLNRHLESGSTIRLLTRRNQTNLDLPKTVTTFHIDLTTSNSDELIPFVEDVDILYHCAGEVRHTALMHAVHVVGTKNLLQAAEGRIGRWVQLSSVGVYGPQKTGVVTEETPLNPQGLYEITKAESDRLVIESAQRGGIQFSMLRPSNVFGINMTNNSLRQFFKIIQRGLFFFIGPRGASANYIHVQNVVNALILCGTLPQATRRIYNLSDQRSLEHFIEIIAKALGKRPPRKRAPESLCRFIAHLFGCIPGMPLTPSRIDALVNRCIYTNSRIEKELGYSHKVSMEEGLYELAKEFV